MDTVENDYIPLIEHIEITQDQVIADIRLENLGHINVVCGKNNSGKTTVLNHLFVNGKERFGLGLNDEVKGKVQEFQQIVYQKLTAHPYYAQVIQTAFNSLFALPILYRHHISHFGAGFSQEMQRYSINENQIFGRLFYEAHLHKVITLPKAYNWGFIPAKRQIQVRCDSVGPMAAEPNGQHLLNKLFTLKNAPLQSDLHNLWREIDKNFRKVTGECEFDIVFHGAGQGNSIRLLFKKAGCQWLYAENCGQGLHEVLLLLYFILAADFDILFIEEPENHMHPDMQRKLAAVLTEQTKKQFFLSTHSHVFLSNLIADRVFLTRSKERIIVEDVTDKAVALDELGYAVADHLVADLIILVEGATDWTVIEHFLRLKQLLPAYNIKHWILCGDAMVHVDLKAFADQHTLMALVDSDPGSATVRSEFMKNCRDANIPCHKLTRYAIENYFTFEALEAALPVSLPDALKVIQQKEKIEKQIPRYQKKWNKSVAEAMSLEDLKGTDLLTFLNKVEWVCKNMSRT